MLLNYLAETKLKKIRKKIQSWGGRQFLRIRKVKFGDAIEVLGFPVILKHPRSEIIIGDRVRLHSDVDAYALAMYSRVKLHTRTEKSRIIIGDDVILNGTAVIAKNNTISIGCGTIIAANCVIADSDWHHVWPPHNRANIYSAGDKIREGPVEIGENVWIGMNTIILCRVTIGKNSIISAGSLVTRRVPPNVIAGGVPARVLRKIGPKDG